MIRKFPTTPIHRLNDQEGGNRVYIKRDDLLPFSFGGNKVRIAEKYIEDMKRKNCNCMIAYGNSRSNLCRVISNMCKSRDIPCYIVSPADDSGERIKTNNSSLVEMMGAHVIPCLKSNVSETISDLLERCETQGLRPYYIYGDIYGKGNEKVAVQAYDEVYDEIAQQEVTLGKPFDYIFVACGTGTTLAGLICGQQRYDNRADIIGVSIARDKSTAKNAVDYYLRKYMVNSPNNLKSESVLILDDYRAGGYGGYNVEILRTIKSVMLNEGIALDTTYTGKAFYGMKQFVRKQQIRNKNILFIHTGGTPLFFDNIRILYNEAIQEV